MRSLRTLILGCLIAWSAAPLYAGQSCPIHADDPGLLASLAQPVPTTNVIPTNWADVGDQYVSAQAHWSKADGTMRHSHFEFPKALMYCEINGPITIPFRIVLFQTDGYLDANLVSQNSGHIVWDDPTIAATGRIAGDPSEMGLVIKTGHLTIDPTHTTGWWDAYNAPPHGWYNEFLGFLTHYDDGTVDAGQVLIPLYSTLDVSQPETVPYDPLYPRVTSQWRGIEVFSTPGGAGEDFWGANIVGVDQAMLPTFGTLQKPYTLPETALGGASYGGAAFEPGGLTLDLRIGENLHMGVLGTVLSQTAVPSQIACCSIHLPITFDPAQLGTGDVKPTANWNQTGGPVPPTFPTRRTVSALLTIGVHSDPSGSPPPPPPPPIVTCYVGTVNGTQTDSGPITPTGAIVWTVTPCP